MGCDSYSVGLGLGNGAWGEVSVRISDVDGWPCLCTVRPDSHNTDPFNAEDIRAFAAIGALVVLAHHGDVATSDGYLFIPEDLPPAVREAIERFIPVQAEARP